MKKFHLNIFIYVFVILSIFLLTGCGGGGSSSSSNGSGGSNNSSPIQAACIANVITNLKNNSNNIFPSTSTRLNSNNTTRASLTEIATGEELMKLCGITQITNEGGFVDIYNDSILKFLNRNSKNIIFQSNSIKKKKNGNYHIGLTITNLGKARIKT